MKTISAILTIFAASTSITAIANEWVTLHHGSNSSVVYETSLIEKNGFFSKDFKVWLKATYEKVNVDYSACGAKPSTRSDQIFNQEALSYSLCMQSASRLANESVKEIVYSVGFNCDKKMTFPIIASAVNMYGNPINGSLQIGSHPGSLGYSLMEHYCK